MYGKQTVVLSILLAVMLVLTGSIVGTTPKSPMLGGLAPILILGVMTWYLIVLVVNANEVIAGIAAIFKLRRQTPTQTNFWLTIVVCATWIALGLFILWIGLPQRIISRIEEIIMISGGTTPRPTQTSPISGLFLSAPVVYYGIVMSAAIFVVSFYILLKGFHLALKTRETDANSLEAEVEAKREAAEVVRQAITCLRVTKEYHDTILQCYKSMCKILSGAGIEGGPAETAREFAESVSTKLQIGRDSVRGLTFLFEEARYSNHEIPEEKRMMALGHLESLQQALSASVGTSQ